MNATFRKRRRLASVMLSAVCVIVTSCVAGVGAAPPAFVTRVTAAETAKDVQVSIIASAPVQYQLIRVQPNWIVLQIAPARLKIQAGTLPFAGDVVRRIRVGQFAPQIVRVVVEMARPSPFHVTSSRAEVAVVVGLAQATQPASTTEHALVATPVPNRGTQRPAPRGHVVLPGEGVGPVLLGMRMQDVLAALGPAKSTQTLADGNTLYEWFAPPTNRGLGVRATAAGVVYRVWALNDDQYAVGDGVHIGSTEAFARAALGEPPQVLVDARRGIRTLNYPARGLWVAIQIDPRFAYYGKVFEIGVTKPEGTTAGP